jgi:SAM-dependent methyltransferase
MDRVTASELAHGGLTLLNPLSEELLDDVIGRLAPPTGGVALDVGCGRGEALLRVVERHGVRGVGLDLHAPYVEDARRRATGEVEFHVADAGAFPYAPDGYDVAMTVGSSHALGGDWRHGLERLRELVRPGGEVLLGEGYWRREPDPRYLEALGATADELPDYAGLIAGALEAGLTPLYAAVAGERDWDRYEWTLVLNGERHAAAHPDDPETDDLRAWVRAGRDRYLAPGGRDTLGFGLFLFSR